MPDYKDNIFKESIEKPSDFKFDGTVVNVFDDMVGRSVPMYHEIQRMIAELAADFVQQDSIVYDLGCSTGATLLSMNETIPAGIKFCGVDDSAEMLEECDKKLRQAHFNRPYELTCQNLHENVVIKNASVVVLCLTLQFLRPLFRERLLSQIYKGLNSNGVLILIEKVIAEEQFFNREFIKYYYNFKRRNHYSDMEIAQKREALENVLIPYKQSENMHMLKEAGFAYCETFFKWYNFTGIAALKK